MSCNEIRIFFVPISRSCTLITCPCKSRKSAITVTKNVIIFFRIGFLLSGLLYLRWHTVPDLKQAWRNIAAEIKVLFPELNYYAISNDGLQRADTIPANNSTQVSSNLSMPTKIHDKAKL